MIATAFPWRLPQSITISLLTPLASSSFPSGHSRGAKPARGSAKYLSARKGSSGATDRSTLFGGHKPPLVDGGIKIVQPKGGNFKWITGGPARYERAPIGLSVTAAS